MVNIDENKMYEYLEEHAYISKNKKSNYQFELTKERAECIANKYNSLVEEKDKEIDFHKNNEQIAIDCQNKLNEKIERINNNWNELEKYLNDKVTMYGRFGDLSRAAECQIILQKLQELKGDDVDGD